MTESKLAVVTGGGGDIGRAIGARLAAGGWRVVLVDLSESALDAARAAIPGASVICADVTDAAAVERAFDGLPAAPDLIVNNAGIARRGPLHEIEIAEFRKVVEVNLIAPFVVARAAARRMIPKGSGSIVNVTSLNAIVPGFGNNAYPATKAGLAMLTEQMALEWGPLGLRVNAVAPGFIDAGMAARTYRDPNMAAARRNAVPSRRIGRPEDVAEAVFWLASDAAAYVNGHQLVVDGGVSMSLMATLSPSFRD
jgi:NAD(P)-dependent dehydrogenase (short-subunit alcohol dehydrogenase family)